MTSRPRIYMDSCPFIDMVKGAVGAARSIGRGSEIFFIKQLLEAARAGEIELYTSTLTVVECTHADGDTSSKVTTLLTKLLTSGQYVRLVTPDPFVAERGRDLRWKNGIVISGRGADYLHLASALHAACGEFITTDGRTDGKGIIGVAAQIAPLGMRVRKPSESMLLPSERRQISFLESNPTVVKFRGRKKSQPKP